MFALTNIIIDKYKYKYQDHHRQIQIQIPGSSSSNTNTGILEIRSKEAEPFYIPDHQLSEHTSTTWVLLCDFLQYLIFMCRAQCFDPLVKNCVGHPPDIWCFLSRVLFHERAEQQSEENRKKDSVTSPGRRSIGGDLKRVKSSRYRHRLTCGQLKRKKNKEQGPNLEARTFSFSFALSWWLLWLLWSSPSWWWL